MLRRLSKRRLIRLEADNRLLDKRLTEMVATNAAFAQLYELLTSMPGVGPVLAFTLIALLPELGKMSRKQIAALVGLAPYDFDSGKLRGHRSIYGGRMPIRNVLYMAALSASRYNPALRAFSNRLADANKKSKVIILAVMRKMITTLKAMLRDNAAWQLLRALLGITAGWAAAIAVPADALAGGAECHLNAVVTASTSGCPDRSSGPRVNVQPGSAFDGNCAGRLSRFSVKTSGT